MSALQWNILQSGTIDQIEFIGSPVSAWRAAAPTPLSSPSLHLPVWSGLGWAGLVNTIPVSTMWAAWWWWWGLDTRFYRPRVQGLQPRGGMEPTSGDHWRCEHQWPESGAVRPPVTSTEARPEGAPQPGATEHQLTHAWWGVDTADNNMHAVMLEDLHSFSAFHCQLFTSGA